MAIPDFQTVMRPLLEEYSDGAERPVAEVRQRLATRFHLTPDELAETIPSGRAKTWLNRVGWATSYLYNVGALERTRRSVYRITSRGQELLAQHPDRIDLQALDRFPELREFRS